MFFSISNLEKKGKRSFSPGRISVEEVLKKLPAKDPGSLQTREKPEKKGMNLSSSLTRIYTPLDKDDGLVIRDFKTAPAPGIWAGEKVVDPHQVVTRFGEFGPIGIAGPCRDTLLLRAPQPADLKLGRLSALRTSIQGLLRLRRLRVKVSLIHIF